MSSHAVLRNYPNGLYARITPRGDAFLLELYDEHGRRKPDLPVITGSLAEAQQMADDHAGVSSGEPWTAAYPDTLSVPLSKELQH